MKLAGETNASFLDIDSNLGIGFYILIVYSVVAGFLQFSLRIRICDGSKKVVVKNENAVVAWKRKGMYVILRDFRVRLKEEINQLSYS